jgi:hypothetical protein
MLLGRYVFPALLKGYVKHYSKKFYDDMELKKNEQNSREGDVKISGNKDEKRKKKIEDGEYVDYEEIK